MKKKSMNLHVMWHIDALMHPFPVTIVTTIGNEGKVNAAPYSLVVPFCSSPKNPQLLLISNKNWHTAKNIEATHEFVVNYPTADHLQEITKTACFYPEGVNELDYTMYSTMPSNKVQPPRIVECYQHIECKVHEILKPSKQQINIIANVLDISLNDGLYELPRTKRALKANAPVYFGMDDERQHLYGQIAKIASVDLECMPARNHNRQ